MGNITANLKSPISVLRLQIMINQEFELIITNKNLNELERDTLTVKNILSEMMEMETIKNQINKDVWEELE